VTDYSDQAIQDIKAENDEMILKFFCPEKSSSQENQDEN